LGNHLENLIKADKGLTNDDEARAVQGELNELESNDPKKAALDQRLAAVIRGEAPKDNPERLQLAGRAYEKRLFAASTQFYGDALEADPKLVGDRQAQHRYNAACAAALAAGKKTARTLPSPIKGEEKKKSSSPVVGEDTGGGAAAPVSDAEQSRLRDKARTWLEAELATWAKLLESASADQRPAVAGALRHWQQDLDLAGVREEAALAELPATEREQWKALWGQVAALLDKASRP
jgi:hypothetical protein